VWRAKHLTIFSVPDPRPLVTGPHAARVLRLGDTKLTLSLGGPGSYRIAVRYSPYWTTTRGCVTEENDHMLRLTSPLGGRVDLSFKLGATRALQTLVGARPDGCAR
jgi:hypothetical protein